MILYPAIDLKGGRCVRLVRGDMNAATVFNDDPADQARSFVRDGFTWLHVVDLDAAVSGSSVNEAAVAAILSTVGVPVQLGGGVRTLQAVERWLEAGVSRVIIGTAAVTDPDLVREAAARYPEQVAVQGWTGASDLGAVELSKRFEDAGVAALIVTDIGRDGTLTGVNVEAVGEVADALSIPVIASGGVAGLDDILKLKARPGAPIAGAVLGKSLYAGTLKPAEALAAARRAPATAG